MNKTFSTKKLPTNKGAVYLFVVFMLTVTTVAMAIGFTQPNIREHRNSIRDNISNNAFLLAEAGNEDVFYRLKNGMNVPAQILMTLNNTESTTTVTLVDATTREIITNSAVDNHTRKSKLRINNTTTQAEFLYGAQIGTWGVSMDANAEVRGILPAVGDIYSNGSVRGTSNNVTVTGNIFVSTAIVADVTNTSVSCVQDHIVGQTNPVVDHAQSFVATSTGDVLHGVELHLKKNGNPSSVTVHIVADNAGAPDTTTITSGTLDRNKVTSSYSWVGVTFDSAVSLTGGNTYWIVLDAFRHNSKYWVWCKDTANPYAGGTAAYTQDWTSPSWTGITGDLTFKMLYGEGQSLIQSVDDIQGDAHADTIDTSIISGDAYYQTISGGSVAGTSYPGSPTPPLVAQPITDSLIANWVAGAEAGGTISGNCPGSAGCGTSMGPIKVDGDFTVVNGSSTVVTGTIYVTGNFLTDNNVNVSCDPTYGTTSCIIIADGFMDFRNNTSFDGSGTSGSFIMLISRKADCIGTSGTGCGPGNSAIYHNNNASTGGIFFAQDSIAVLENNTSVSTVVARGLDLSNNAAVIYNVDLQDIELSAGFSGGWLVEDWREIE